ncbi:serine hydrolase domain-containing protein [Parvularcula dongshanensis]|uniref:serine hydrolase domain-containing protein n=1 Tax=Parvularcula dongshanensis TaxID=1173995 RepID=UPI0016132989
MRTLSKASAVAVVLLGSAAAQERPEVTPLDAIEAAARQGMDATGAKGLAFGFVEDGEVVGVRVLGDRNADGEPLTGRTVMYGASLTKAAFAYMVVQLAEEGVIDLDEPIPTYLSEPLTAYDGDPWVYAPYATLAGDDRWRRITPRMLLMHSAGFANFWFLEPDRGLHIHFEPGSRYAYSGDGFILMQYVLEKGLGLDVGEEMDARVFEPLGMTRTGMIWREDFADDLADGWTMEGEPVPHDDRSKVRAAGSMDTTITDVARFAAGLVRCENLSSDSCAQLTAPSLPITTPAQFPTLTEELPADERRADLSAGLGVVTFEGPQGPAFYKGGHDENTGNTLVCLKERRDCVVILSNDVRAEAAFPSIVEAALGETGAPWAWEYSSLKLER